MHWYLQVQLFNKHFIFLNFFTLSKFPLIIDKQLGIFRNFRNKPLGIFILQGRGNSIFKIWEGEVKRMGGRGGGGDQPRRKLWYEKRVEIEGVSVRESYEIKCIYWWRNVGGVILLLLKKWQTSNRKSWILQIARPGCDHWQTPCW